MEKTYGMNRNDALRYFTEEKKRLKGQIKAIEAELCQIEKSIKEVEQAETANS